MTFFGHLPPFWLGVLNGLLYLKLVIIQAQMKKRLGWFKEDHLQLPQWVVLAAAVLSSAISITPLYIDTILIGAIIYFGNEAWYQATKNSPLGSVFKALTMVAETTWMNFVGKVTTIWKGRTNKTN